MGNNKGIIIHEIDHKKGRRNDYGVYKRNQHLVPKEVVNVYDLGFLGVEKDYPEQKSVLHIKKKRNQKELTLEEEKEYNRIHSKKRIVAEHAICRLKKYRIMRDVFRNRVRKYEFSDIVSGLVNYMVINVICFNMTKISRSY